MNRLISFTGNWFGYTRRERRSSFILLALILITTGIRLIVPERKLPLVEIPVEYSGPVLDTNEIPGPGYITKVYNSEQKSGSPVDINSCDSAALESLHGIGPVLSSRIIKFRKLIGGFISVDQLREVYGLPEETLKLNSANLYADTSKIRKIRINSAGYKELIRHPYFKKEEVSDIIKYRKLKGEIKNVNELIINNIISAETGKRIRPYLAY